MWMVVARAAPMAVERANSRARGRAAGMAERTGVGMAKPMVVAKVTLRVGLKVKPMAVAMEEETVAVPVEKARVEEETEEGTGGEMDLGSVDCPGWEVDW
jgi:hypothetical protein